MKFEELSGIWNSADLALDKSIQINKELVKNIGISKVRSGLYEIKLTAVIGIIAGIFFSIFLSGFFFNHVLDFKFSFPAFILLVIILFSLIIEMYKLILIYTLDSKSPVTEARKKLMRLKKLEILDTYSLCIIIPLFSAPFMIVIAKAFLHLNLYAFNTNWLIYFTAGSIVIALILVFFLRKYPGKNLAKSIAFLNELKEDDDRV
ncbi:MAG: hypothetical protein M3Z92_16560 [Bacteroidota bacterium]|nr:hypothetical protein [Bacteroidota bacterium]